MSGDRSASRESDPLRLLHQRSEFGYTDRVDRALRDEPEAVRADEQRTLTALGHRRDGQRRLEAYLAMRTVVFAALDGFTATCGTDPRLTSSVRGIRRSVAGLERQIQ